MKQPKRLVAAGVLSAAVLSGGLFTLSASAQDAGSDDSLASKIATKFNLNKDEVQTVVNEHREEKRAEHQAEHKARLEERLTRGVSDGDLTEEQKTKILEYLESQSSFMDSLKDKTPEERREAMDAHRDEMEQWAEDNGIDDKYLRFGGGLMKHGPGGPRFDDDKGGEARELN